MTFVAFTGGLAVARALTAAEALYAMLGSGVGAVRVEVHVLF